MYLGFSKSIAPLMAMLRALEEASNSLPALADNRTVVTLTCSKGCNRSLCIVQALSYCLKLPCWCPSIVGLDTSRTSYSLCETFDDLKLAWLDKLAWSGVKVAMSGTRLSDVKKETEDEPAIKQVPLAEKAPEYDECTLKASWRRKLCSL